MSALVPLALALAFLGLSRWGSSNAAALAAGTTDDRRRAGEERRLRKGARSCLVLSVVCGALAVVHVALLVLDR